MKVTNTDGEQIYADEVQQYGRIFTAYNKLTDVDQSQAFSLMKESLALRERFSELHFIERRREKFSKVKDAALKDRLEEIYKILGEIHTGSRMIWKRGQDEPGV